MSASRSTYVYSFRPLLLSSPLSSWNGIAGACKVDRLLRPAFQRGMSGVGENIHAALDAIEPAIDVVQKNFCSVGNLWPQIAYPPRPLRQGRGAGQRLLTIGGHD